MKLQDEPHDCACFDFDYVWIDFSGAKILTPYVYLTDYFPPLQFRWADWFSCFVFESRHCAPTILCHHVRAMANKQTGSDDKSLPAMGARPTLPDVGGERLSMSDYQTLTHLLERAGRESRLGEVLFYSGLTEKTQEQIAQYDGQLKGTGPWVFAAGGQQPTVPRAKSVAKKGQDMLATMGLAATVPSSSTSCPVPVPSLPLMGLQQPQMNVIDSGSIAMPGSSGLQQQPSSSQSSEAANAQVGDTILRWKAKWGPDGTVRGIGYPVAAPDLSDNRQLRGSPPEASVAAGAESMEIGNTKRGLEVCIEEDMDEGWECVHDEVLQQLSNASPDLIGQAYQGPPNEQGSWQRQADGWYPPVNYQRVNALIDIPARANHDPVQWGKTAAELPKLQELGLWGRSYEALVRQALGGDKALASYLSWLRSHFEAAYTRRGPCSKGIDFAGYLTYIRFQAPVDGDGFHRRFV